jgi:hypothetical protein
MAELHPEYSKFIHGAVSTTLHPSPASNHGIKSIRSAVSHVHHVPRRLHANVRILDGIVWVGLFGAGCWVHARHRVRSYHGERGLPKGPFKFCRSTALTYSWTVAR